jgi:hypothetical protein
MSADSLSEDRNRSDLMGSAHYGEERREMDEQKAQGIVTEELKGHGWKEAELTLDEKAIR